MMSLLAKLLPHVARVAGKKIISELTPSELQLAAAEWAKSLPDDIHVNPCAVFDSGDAALLGKPNELPPVAEIQALLVERWRTRSSDLQHEAQDFFQAPEEQALPQLERLAQIVHTALASENPAKVLAQLARENAVVGFGVPWAENPGNDPSRLLDWRSREPEVQGRDKEGASLLAWATSNRAIDLGLICGSSGTGKSRIAAELGQALQDRGWLVRVGYRWNFERDAGKSKRLIYIGDYAEEHVTQISEALGELAEFGKPPHEIRLLLVTRHDSQFWQRIITHARASSIYSGFSLQLGELSEVDAIKLLEQVFATLSVSPTDEEREIATAWLQEREHRTPLLIAGLGAHVATGDIHRGVAPHGLFHALCQRETLRLQREAEERELPVDCLVALTAIAGIVGKLDEQLIRAVVSECGDELGLLAPSAAVRALRRSPRWSGGWPALGADLLRAVLVEESLPELLSPDLLWWALVKSPDSSFAKLDRAIHDILALRSASGAPPRTPSIVSVLCDAMSLEHAKACSQEGVTSAWSSNLAPLGVKALLRASEESDDGDAVRLKLNLAAMYRRTGDGRSAVEVTRSALEQAKKLDLGVRQHFECLTALASELAGANDPEAATRMREALGLAMRDSDLKKEITEDTRFIALLCGAAQCAWVAGERLVARRSLEKALEIAGSIDTGQGTQATAYTLASTYSSASYSLHHMGDHKQAVQVHERAVDIWRSLAREAPVLFGDDLAQALTYLAVRLTNAAEGDVSKRRERAFAAAREAVAIARSRHDPTTHSGTVLYGEALDNLAVTHLELEEYEEAAQQARAALKLFTEYGSVSPEVASLKSAHSITNLSRALLELGKGRAGLRLLKRGIDRRRAVIGTRPIVAEGFIASLRGAAMIANKIQVGDPVGDYLLEALQVARECAEDDFRAFGPKMIQVAVEVVSYSGPGRFTSPVEEAIDKVHACVKANQDEATTAHADYTRLLATHADNLGGQKKPYRALSKAREAVEFCLRIGMGGYLEAGALYYRARWRIATGDPKNARLDTIQARKVLEPLRDEDDFDHRLWLAVLSLCLLAHSHDSSAETPTGLQAEIEEARQRVPD